MTLHSQPVNGHPPRGVTDPTPGAAAGRSHAPQGPPAVDPADGPNGAGPYGAAAAGPALEESAPVDAAGADVEADDLSEPAAALGAAALPITALLESLLFVAEEPVAAEQLARALGQPAAAVEMGLEQLGRDYVTSTRGLRLQERGGRYQLVTVPAAARTIEAFLHLDLSSRLSGPALETLAIVAYRQPVTKGQIEAVRGVDCGGVLRTLLQYELIEDVGRLESVGRPILYAVTDRFMQHFGFTSLHELPPLQNADADALWAATELAEEPPAQ